MKPGKQSSRDVKTALRASGANDVRKVQKFAKQEIPSADLHKFKKRLAKIKGKRRCTLKVGVKGFRTQVGRVIWSFAQRLGTVRPTRIHSVPQRGKRLRDYLLNRVEAFTKVVDTPPQPPPTGPKKNEGPAHNTRGDESFGDIFCELADPTPEVEENRGEVPTDPEIEIPRSRTPDMFAQRWGVDGRKSVCTCQWLGLGGSLVGSPLEDMCFQIIDGHVTLTTCMPGNYKRLFNMREVEKVRAPLLTLGRVVPSLPSLKDMCCPTSPELKTALAAQLEKLKKQCLPASRAKTPLWSPKELEVASRSMVPPEAIRGEVLTRRVLSKTAHELSFAMVGEEVDKGSEHMSFTCPELVLLMQKTVVKPPGYVKLTQNYFWDSLVYGPKRCDRTFFSKIKGSTCQAGKDRITSDSDISETEDVHPIEHYKEPLQIVDLLSIREAFRKGQPMFTKKIRSLKKQSYRFHRTAGFRVLWKYKHVSKRGTRMKILNVRQVKVRPVTDASKSAFAAQTKMTARATSYLEDKLLWDSTQEPFMSRMAPLRTMREVTMMIDRTNIEIAEKGWDRKLAQGECSLFVMSSDIGNFFPSSDMIASEKEIQLMSTVMKRNGTPPNLYEIRQNAEQHVRLVKSRNVKKRYCDRWNPYELRVTKKSSKKSKRDRSLTVSAIQQILRRGVNNAFLRLGGRSIYKQISGSPQGTSEGPVMSGLFAGRIERRVARLLGKFPMRLVTHRGYSLLALRRYVDDRLGIFATFPSPRFTQKSIENDITSRFFNPKLYPGCLVTPEQTLRKKGESLVFCGMNVGINPGGFLSCRPSFKLQSIQTPLSFSTASETRGKILARLLRILQQTDTVTLIAMGGSIIRSAVKDLTDTGHLEQDIYPGIEGIMARILSE